MSRPLRVLDIGAHDGFVGAWLKERFPGDVELYGLELHPEFAAQAEKRGYTVKVGAGEDAPRLFEPGRFDAVLLFEVVEHVPDVDQLLSAAEQMLTPGGRIYVSTPDGTFGAGSNPHHLRALRSIDLADLLRRRGTLEDFRVGRDDVSVAAYTPRQRLGDVAIYCGPGWQKWAPTDIYRRGLGGSETAAVRLAHELSELGYVVTVYGDVHQGAFRDVLYRDWQAFDPTETRAAVISSRTPELFDRPIAALRKLLWLHDTDAGDRLTPARAACIDHVLVLSEWQQRHVARLYPFLRSGQMDAPLDRVVAELVAGEDDRTGSEPAANPKLVRIRNGIDNALFDLSPAPRARRAVYTSSPDRGLDVLLEIWPKVREQVPDAQLAHAYSPVYFEMAERDPQLAAFACRIRELSEQPGVETLGSLTQPQVAQLMSESLVWCAPSYNSIHAAPFHETSCIGAMEAQAAGCRVVASNWGALPETVRTGVLIDGPAGSRQWKQRLVKAIVEGLTNEKVQHYSQAVGPEWAMHLGWVPVAEQVAQLISG